MLEPLSGGPCSIYSRPSYKNLDPSLDWVWPALSPVTVYFSLWVCNSANLGLRAGISLWQGRAGLGCGRLAGLQ